ncbi:DUF7511 domain-containing protein [Halohasta salina]|uniref:DUF7511 domain-containing protein n=1 Tax=Halohasta salina TaxID=2961621 RepID=UPI0020A4E695|nr:hypothetical protein [Halohasta salina]
MPSTNHPDRRPPDEPSAPGDGAAAGELVFAGRTTTTPDGRTEYTVFEDGLAPTERMTRWLTVDAEQVVSLADRR